MALGKILRETREQRGFSVAQVAEGTHMMPQIVEELECEDFHRIAAPIYGRGFIKLYAEFLGIEADPLVDEFNAIYSGARRPVVATRPVSTTPERPPAATADRPAPAAPAAETPPWPTEAPAERPLSAEAPPAAEVPPHAAIRAASAQELDDLFAFRSAAAREPTHRPPVAADAAPVFDETRRRPARRAVLRDDDPLADLETPGPSLFERLGNQLRASWAAAARWMQRCKRPTFRWPSLGRPRFSRLTIAIAAAIAVVAAVLLIALVSRRHAPRPRPASAEVQTEPVPLKIANVLPPPDPYVD